MRSIFAASLFLATSIALTGCAVNVDKTDDEQAGDSSETAGALSAYGNKLVGAYTTTNSASDFDVLVLKADGTYFAEERVVCIKAPCPAIRQEGKFIGYKPAGSGYLGGLRLNPKKGASVYYRVSLGSPNESFKLSRDGKTFFLYETTKSGTFCSAAKDCKGQSYIHPMCVGYETCNADTSSCGWKCGTPAPACDYSGTGGKSYIGKSTEQCMLIKFACAEGFQYFSDSCGCGCEPVKTPPCYVGGCSGQICSDKEGVMSTCIFKPEYACYAKTTCERNAAGACAWKNTPEFAACLKSPPSAE